jgi:two-component system cell cycle response regulator DivK
MDDAAIQGRARAGPTSDAGLSRCMVLLIEDNADSREVYSIYLAHVGFAVLTASDAEAGLLMAAERSPDVVVMDVELPGMDGYDATRRLKADPATRHARVVALTAHALPGEDVRARTAGCDLYLAKPLDPARLAAELRALLEP